MLNIDEYGNRFWKNAKGELHRIDGGPAIEWSSGTKEWFLNGKRHRIDGPAYEDVVGNKFWYLNGKFHRINGPSIEHANGERYWFIKGDQYIEESYWEKIGEIC